MGIVTGAFSKLDGKANTELIIERCTENNIPARICNNYSVIWEGTTYDDWYLPAIDELGYITVEFTNTSFPYWSSTEYDSIGGNDVEYRWWLFDCCTPEGNTYNVFMSDITSKDAKHRVRAFREF